MQLKKRLLILGMLLILLSSIVYSEVMCDVSDVKITLQKGLYAFLVDPGSSGLQVEQIKDLLVFYINLEQGTPTADCSVRGYYSNISISQIITNIERKTGNVLCKDGTQYGKCSASLKYCYAGTLVDRCYECGCNNQSCNIATGLCEETDSTIRCNTDLNCGVDDYVGERDCSDNNVTKDYMTFTCNSPNTAESDCTNSTTPIVIETCELGCSGGACVDSLPQGYFTFRIDTDKILGTTFSFQADNADLSVDWGDNSNSTATGTGLISHTYATEEVYDISLNGIASRISYYEGTEDALIDVLTEVSEGIIGINSAYQMFRDTAFGITPLTEPAFFDDVSGDVTNMTGMFSNSQFNQDISDWDVSSVTIMRVMFYASQFNQDISDWDVSSVTDMNYMFTSSQFDQDLSGWCVTNIPSEPDGFDDGADNWLNIDWRPAWGTCP